MNEDFVEAQRFCEDVIRYSFVQFGSLSTFYSNSRYFTNAIGQAVVSLQIILRDELKVVFLDSIGMIVRLLPRESATEEIRSLLDWYYFKGDIFNFLLANLATTVELLFCMDELDLNLPRNWFPLMWAHVFRDNMSEELEKNGGWRELSNRAQRRYVASGIYEEKCEVIETKIRYPYDSVGEEFPNVHFLEYLDAKKILVRRIPEMSTAELSMRMMKFIYPDEKLISEEVVERLRGNMKRSTSIFYCLSEYPAPVAVERLI